MFNINCRFALLRNTQQGKLEERMPFFSFLLPKWFDRKYPRMASNMRNNTRRLTTPFDVYSTLMSVLHRNGPKSSDVNKRSISLFDKVSIPVIRNTRPFRLFYKSDTIRIYFLRELLQDIFRGKLYHFIIIKQKLWRELVIFLKSLLW